MKIASVRELRNSYKRVLGWVEAGEEVVIQRRGKPVARLVAERQKTQGKPDWSMSAAFRRDKTAWPVLTAEQSLEAVHEASGRW